MAVSPTAVKVLTKVAVRKDVNGHDFPGVWALGSGDPQHTMKHGHSGGRLFPNGLTEHMLEPEQIEALKAHPLVAVVAVGASAVSAYQGGGKAHAEPEEEEPAAATETQAAEENVNVGYVDHAPATEHKKGKHKHQASR